MKIFFILLNVASLFHIIFTQTDVRLPPTLTKWSHKKQRLCEDGGQFTLECGAEGTPDVKYEWRKNGFELNTNLSNISKGSDGTITATRATVIDEGYYQCLASNQYGAVLSDTIEVRLMFTEPTVGPSPVLEKTVVEGMPFHIPAHRPRDSLGPRCDWEIPAGINAQYDEKLRPSKRIQIADNGDLHFAYALPEDAAGEIIYKCTLFLSDSPRRTRTQLSVTRNSTGNITHFAPTLAFSSEKFYPKEFLSPMRNAAVVGDTIKLMCFFYGFPQPMISWRGPTDTLPTGRHQVYNFNTTLYLQVVASDEGNYSCTASNTEGDNTRIFQIRVGVEPSFNNTKHGPYNVNVTEGESVTFKCNAFAEPEAKIVWFQNGQPMDTGNPPERFVFSSDNKSLTIRDVCRDCVDQERQTDLMVIQCNASNVYGYAFAQGYLNVLLKTNVTITISKNVSVDFLTKKQFVIQCNATSDPSTPPTVQWYKSGDLVRDELPYVQVTKEVLIITIDSNCSDCAKYLGEYICTGDNVYSRNSRTIRIPYDEHITEDITMNKETWAVWKIILVAVAIGFVLFLIGIFLYPRWKRRFGDVKRQTIERRIPNPSGMYEDVGYDSIGFPLEEIVGGNDRSMIRESGEYDHIGYDSIDKVLDEIGDKEYAMPHSIDVHGQNRYESLDAPQNEAIGRGRPTLDKGIRCDEVGYLMPLEEVINGGGKDQQQINGYESMQSESEKFPKSNDESELLNTYLDPNREEVSDNLDMNTDLVSKEVNQYLDLVSNETDPYLGLNSKEFSQYLDLGLKEVNQYLDLDPEPRQVNQYMDLDPKEVNQYLDLDTEPREVNQYLDLNPKEVTQYMNMGPREVNQNLDLNPREVNQYVDLGSNRVNQNLDLTPREMNQNLDLNPREVNQYVDLGSNEVNQNLDLNSSEVNLLYCPKEVNQCLDLGPKEMDPSLNMASKAVNP